MISLLKANSRHPDSVCPFRIHAVVSGEFVSDAVDCDCALSLDDEDKNIFVLFDRQFAPASRFEAYIGDHQLEIRMRQRGLSGLFPDGPLAHVVATQPREELCERKIQRPADPKQHRQRGMGVALFDVAQMSCRDLGHSGYIPEGQGELCALFSEARSHFLRQRAGLLRSTPGLRATGQKRAGLAMTSNDPSVSSVWATAS